MYIRIKERLNKKNEITYYFYVVLKVEGKRKDVFLFSGKDIEDLYYRYGIYSSGSDKFVKLYDDKIAMYRDNVDRFEDMKAFNNVLHDTLANKRKIPNTITKLKQDHEKEIKRLNNKIFELNNTICEQQETIDKLLPKLEHFFKKDNDLELKEILKAGYKTLAKKYHSDINGGNDEKMKQLNKIKDKYKL